MHRYAQLARLLPVVRSRTRRAFPVHHERRVSGLRRRDLPRYQHCERRIDEIPPLATVSVPVEPRSVSVEPEPLEPRLVLHRRLWVAVLLMSIIASVVAVVHFGATPVVLADVCGTRDRAYRRAAAAGTRPKMRGVPRCATPMRRSSPSRISWRSIANMHDLEQQKAQLQAKLAAYRALPAKYTAERARLEADKPRLQLRAHLDRFLIDDAKIKGIGKKRKATLLSYGIETALDIEDRLAGTYIPKFGDSTRSALFGWVYHLKLAFRFDPSKLLDPAILNDLQARENRERSDLERDLRGGPQALRTMAEQRVAQRESLRPEIVRAAEAAAKARADYRVFRRL